MKVTSISEMRMLDKRAVEQFGILEPLLMENAGQAVCQVIARECGGAGKTFAIFCGIGNNGGDGLVIARKLHSNGALVQVYLLGDPQKFAGAAKLNFEIVSRLSIVIQRLESADAASKAVCGCDAIVDAIFGTGMTRDVEGLHREVIEMINASGKPVFSVDIPSGVHGDTGQIKGAAVKADYTITFGLPKIGNLLFPGYELGGKLAVSHISFPPEMYADDALKIALNTPIPLPPRPKDGHKGTFGDVLFIAGSATYFGAPYFAAAAFLKAGGGYARLAAPKSIISVIAGKASEIVFVPQMETLNGSIAFENKYELLELAEKADMVVIGPGMSLHEETQRLIRELAQEIRQPLLIDGDGITAICQEKNLLEKRQAATILTPHVGEMSRLTGVSVNDIQAEKIPLLQRTAKMLNAIIVLKGAHSLIGYSDERVFINMSGNSGMATAGSGDVLTGTIAAMYGLELSIEGAARKGVFVHGVAGDFAAERVGEDGMTAQNILDSLPYAMQFDRCGFPKSLRDRYHVPSIIDASIDF